MTANNKLVAIHQPNYLPWLGYWFKIYRSDIFVLHDNVQFSKHSFTKRTKILPVGNTNTSYLSLPIKKSKLDTLILDMEVQDGNWVGQHLNKIQNNYQQSPFFTRIYPILEQVLNQVKSYKSLSKINETIILSLLDTFAFPKTTIVKSSNLAASGKQEAYLCEIIHELNGQMYLSGVGAKKYQDEAHFKKNSIELIYSDFYQFMVENPYPQKNGAFVNGLSIIDALFYLGIDGIFDIFEAFKTKLSLEYDF